MFLNPQVIENVILLAIGAGSLYLLSRAVGALETIAVLGKLAQAETRPAKLPVTDKELNRILDATEDGRYARITYPDSLRPFKETSE